METMKNKTRLPITLTLAALLFTLLSISSCTKKQGCTDVNATNYNTSAEENDGSCTYDGKLVFWYNQATSDALIADDAFTLTYYLDGQAVGTSSTADYSNSTPACGQNGALTITKPLGSVDSKSFTYSVKDQTAFEYYTGTVTITANACTDYRLQ